MDDADLVNNAIIDALGMDVSGKEGSREDNGPRAISKRVDIITSVSKIPILVNF